MYGISTRVQPQAANGETKQEHTNIDKCQEGLGRCAEILPAINKEPENPRNTVSKPGGEERRDKRQKVVEVGDTAGL